MRIVIDATPLLLRSSGVKTVIHHWTRALRPLLAAHESLRLFPLLDGAEQAELNHEAPQTNALNAFLRLGVLHAADLTGLALPQFLTQAADIFHVTQPIYKAPRHPRLTATIHDMTCWLMPEFHTPANAAATRRFGETVWRQAKGLIAVSASAKADAVRLLDLNPDLIDVIHNGVSEAFHPTPCLLDDAIAKRLQLPPNYILYVGTIEPRKNIPTLLSAFLSLPEDVRQEFPLLLAGPVGWHSEKILARMRAASPQIRYLGYIAETDLPAVTRRATAFVYPSTYEGFGLPVAQAMLSGVPVITSSTPALLEIAGEAALFIDPRSPGELRNAFRELLTNPALRRDLAQRGLAQAAPYRWDRMAAESLAFFRKVHSR